jgi:hypothetical protein
MSIEVWLYQVCIVEPNYCAADILGGVTAAKTVKNKSQELVCLRTILAAHGRVEKPFLQRVCVDTLQLMS